MDEALDASCSRDSQQAGSGKTVYLESLHRVCSTVSRIHAREMHNRVHTLAYLAQSIGGLPAGFDHASRWQPVRWRVRLARSQNRLSGCRASQILCKASSDVPEPAGNENPVQINVRAPDTLLVVHLPVIGDAAVERRLTVYLTVIMRQRCAICEYGKRVPDTLETVPQERRNGYQTVVFG